jgi:hypothetical protein
VTQAIDLLIDGHFDEAVAAYRRDLEAKPESVGVLDGLAAALMAAGRYQEAIPLKWRVHEHALSEIPDSCGQLVDLACAYWCIGDPPRAIELAHSLVAGNLARTINMAPDSAGGASFGLMLHYMAVTTGETTERDYALAFLRKLKAMYDRNPTFFGFPKMTVQQLFGDASFEDSLESASKERSLIRAFAKAKSSRSIAVDLSVVLFNDGAFRRAQGDEAGCRTRMQEVVDIGHWADPIHWYLARHEVQARVPSMV